MRAYEIEASGDDVVPYFEVVEGDVSYDSRSMATGELSSFYLLWSFRTAETYSIILIEEPEAYLPPLSHSAIFALICEQALAKRLGVIMTTHSAAIASEIPERNLLSVRRVSGQSTLPTTGDSRVRVLARLGLGPQRTAVLFVEDQLAANILREIIGIYELSLVIKLEIVVCPDGASGVKNALNGLPASIQSIRFVGILDGDMRSEASKWNSADKLLFLPFKFAMENELLAAAERSPEKVAKLAGRGKRQVEDVLEHTKGLDHHDRFLEVAARLDLTNEKLSGIALARWIKVSGKKTTVKVFVRELSLKLGVSLP